MIIDVRDNPSDEGLIKKCHETPGFNGNVFMVCRNCGQVWTEKNWAPESIDIKERCCECFSEERFTRIDPKNM